MIEIEVRKEVVDDGFVLFMDVLDSSRIPSEVFVWQVDQGFSHVASVKDMSTFNEQESVGTTYYREDNLEQKFASITQLEECLVSYTEAVKQLEIDYVNSLDALGFDDPYTVIVNEDIE